MAFPQSREDACHVDHVVDVIFLDKTLVILVVSDVKFFVLAWEVELLIRDIGSDDIVAAKLFAESPDKGHSDLALTAGNEDAAIFPGDVRLFDRFRGWLSSVCGSPLLHKLWQLTSQSEVG